MKIDYLNNPMPTTNTMKKNGDKLYTFYRKDFCEECGAKNEYKAGNYLVRRKILTVHHVDGNRFNNDPSNLQTLCRKCHDKKHNL